MGVLLIRCSLLFLIARLYLLSIIPTTKSEPLYLYNFCANSSSSNPNTKHQANLNTVFRSLSANANASNPSGFFITSAGNSTSDAVYGLFMCRGDQNTTTCHDCVSTATTTDLPKTYCPKGSQAMIWYDQCMVRYSNEPFFGKLDMEPKFSLTNNQSINGDQNKFTDLLGDMMNNLRVEAASGDKVGKKFAVNRTRFTSLNTLYGLAQCTPDLSRNDCELCLWFAIAGLKIAQGARVLQPSCNVRYETYPFYNGAFEVPAPPPATSNSTGKGNGPGPNNTNSSSMIVGKKQLAKFLGIGIGVLIILTLLGAICIHRAKRKAKNGASTLLGAICIHRAKGKAKNGASIFQSANKFEIDGDDYSIGSLQCSLSALQAATNNFGDDNQIGRGGFGVVYKGTLPNGRNIAVKKLLTNTGKVEEEFKNEMKVVAKLQHRNLVGLLAFCLEGGQRLLVFEYVPNKSLDYFIFDEERRALLDWSARFRIIVGIARGLLYLHEDSRLRIIHRDLKPSNILLDAEMNPKIADFGMARIYGLNETPSRFQKTHEIRKGNSHEDHTHQSTSKVGGTLGYMDPDYAQTQRFSVKTDIYSFGVIILEIISGRRNSTFHRSGLGYDLLSYAWELWKKGIALELIDETLKDSYSEAEVLRCINLGLLCVQNDPNARPTMANVVHIMLNISSTIALPVPQPPTYFASEERADTILEKSSSSSVISDSVTELHPR